ncbi:hypothetical protein ACN9MB_13470 [Dyella kyungheensis]|uniref:hypothetical protein n=1 Tax=Dyella kyungheensis TaxID=1242174 RepID=UPI003CEDEE87
MSADEIQIPEAYDGDIEYRAEELDPTSPRYAHIIAASKAGRLTTSYYQKVRAVPGYHRQTTDGLAWVQPHFSPVGKAVQVEAIDSEATERDITHNDVVQRLCAALSHYKSNFVIATNHPKEKVRVRLKEEGFKFVPKPVRLWACQAEPDFVWRREPWTHRWFERIKYIQPDLVGFDANRAFPGPNNPNVIIEVINFHPPEEETWRRLVELSLNHHWVLFYLCAKGHEVGRFGKMKSRVRRTAKGEVRRLWIQVAFYLKDGIFYDGLVAKTSVGQSNKEQHEIVQKIFKRIKAKYFSGTNEILPSQVDTVTSGGSLPTKT